MFSLFSVFWHGQSQYSSIVGHQVSCTHAYLKMIIANNSMILRVVMLFLISFIHPWVYNIRRTLVALAEVSQRSFPTL